MKHPLHEYFNRINVFPNLALSQSGLKVAYQTSITGSPQIWIGTLPKDGLMSYPRPLTSGKGEQPNVFQHALEWVGDDLLVALMDEHGNEQTFIRLFDTKTGEVKDIAREDGARENLGFGSKDHKTYYFTSNRGNPGAQGLFSYDFKSGKIEKWFQHQTFSAGWVGDKVLDGERLFIIAQGNGVNTLHAIHPRTKKVRDIFTEPGSVFVPIGVLGKGKLLVVSNQGRQFAGLARFDVKTGKLDYVGPDKWDVENADLSPNKKQLLVTRNVAGRSQVELLAWPSLKKQKVSVPNQGIIDGLGFAENGRFAIYGYSSPVNPRDFYVLDLKTRKSRRLTDNWISRVPSKDLVQPQLVQYESQGKQIYSWLFLPKGAKKDGTTPVIFWPHGGPQAQERAQFRPIFQYVVSRGFAIWAPNPHGSTGFGKEFMLSINGQWGTADLPDVENGLEWLKKSGWVDPKRIAVMGGSYGGYMTLRSLTKFPKIFKAAVDIFGVSNLLTFVKSTPPDWRPYMDVMVGSAEKDEEKLRAQSPIFEIEKIACPLMVIQGALDPRVVKAESDQVVERLRKHGREVDYVVFDDEGHGFLKPENELKAFTRAADFLEKHL